MGRHKMSTTEKIEAALQRGKTVQQISQAYGVTKSRVYSVRAKLAQQETTIISSPAEPETPPPQVITPAPAPAPAPVPTPIQPISALAVRVEEPMPQPTFWQRIKRIWA